jgi:ABC-type amino acid transport substrate-binding protein
MLRVLVSVFALLSCAAPGHAQELTGTLGKIKQTGTFTIGYRDASPPFSSVDGKNAPVGYSIDLCLRIAAAAKERLGLSNMKINYVPLTAENRFSAVADGTVDIECGNSTNTLTRQERVDFTNMTFITGASLLARSGSNINSVGDLGGKGVSVVVGTTTEKALDDKLAKGLVQARVVKVKDHGEGMALLEKGTVDAHAADQLVLIGLARAAKDRDKLALAPELFTYEPYGLVVRRNDADFRLVANRALAQLYRTGEISSVYEKWFGDWGGKPSRLLLAMYALNGLPE